MKTGVYKITNLVTGKVYIGSSINIELRWREHKRDLLRNKHHSTKLQRSYNIHGINNFTFEILVECKKDKNTIINLEQYYIDKFNSYKKGYNSRPLADNNLGSKRTETFKKNRSKKMKGRVPWNKGVSPTLETRIRLSESSTNAISIIQYSLQGVYLKEFRSIEDASKYIKKNIHSGISQALSKKRKTAGGFIWFYKNDFKNSEIPKKLDYTIVKELTDSKKGKNRKGVVQFSTKGYFIKSFNSIMDAAKYNNFDRIYIGRICKDKNKDFCKSSGGFTWFFDTDFPSKNIPKILNSEMIKRISTKKTQKK